MKIAWTRHADDDLDEIIDFVAGEDVGAAERLLARVHRAVGRLSRFPRSGRIVPELAEIGVLGLREVVVPPLRVVYEPRSDVVEVLIVFDARRDAQTLLFRRLYGR